MSVLCVVVENKDDWKPYYPSQDVITFDEYLKMPVKKRQRTRVINLCRNYKYLSRGYYCSLLAEARGHTVLPAVQSINDLGRKALYLMQLDGLSELADKNSTLLEGDTLTLRIFFGETEHKALKPLAKNLFERFPAPALELTLERRKVWQLESLRFLSLKDLKTESDQQQFAEAFDRFSRKMWRKAKPKKGARFDLAILYNPDEALPPSDAVALKNFIKAAESLGIEAELITKKDYMRLAEFDALFIRETTNIDHHTYRFAKKAEREGLVVMDDPTSILRCTNKVFLSDLLAVNKVPAPKTRIISDQSKAALDQLADEMGFPMVLKIPDGAFSKGIVKVSDRDELTTAAKQLSQKSALLLAQEFMYTEFDWRIGVLNNKPIYACRYYMVKDHWQIYNHGGAEVESGGFDTLPTYEAPKAVIDAAVKASRLIGDGLYGIDLKQAGDKAYVIEVNDNPSIDSDVEDLWLKQELYQIIMQEFLNRLEKRVSE